MPVQILTLTSAQIEARQSQIVSIYHRAFTPPPYKKPEAEIEEFAQTFLTQFDREAYRFVGALDGNSGRLAGFAYGYAVTAAQWWQRYVRPALPEATAHLWLEDSFQFVEIAVDPGFQGQGIGGRLHDELLRGVQHPRAVLSTLQAETAAHRLYRRRGWVVLGEDIFFPGVERRYQIMGLELRRGEREGRAKGEGGG